MKCYRSFMDVKDATREGSTTVIYNVSSGSVPEATGRVQPFGDNNCNDATAEHRIWHPIALTEPVVKNINRKNKASQQVAW